MVFVIAVMPYCDHAHQTWHRSSWSTPSCSYIASIHIPLLGGASECGGQRAEISQSMIPRACPKLFCTPTIYSSFLKHSRHWQNSKQGLYKNISSGHAELNWRIFSTVMYTENFQRGVSLLWKVDDEILCWGAWPVFLESSFEKCWSRKATPNT